MGDEVTLVEGKVIATKGSLGFLAFVHPDGTSGLKECLFMSKRLFLDGTKIKPANAKASNFETFFQEHLKDVTVKAMVTLNKNENACYAITDNWNVKPSFYSHCVWTGDSPPDDAMNTLEKDDTMNESTKAPSIVNNKEGRIIFRNMLDQGFIRFHHENREEIAQFLLKHLYINGRCIDADGIQNWPQGHVDVECTFNAVKSNKLSQHVQLERNEETGMETEFCLRPQWRCLLVWVGDKPSPEVINESRKQRQDNSVEKKTVNEYKDCDYGCGRVARFIDRTTGLIIANKGCPVLFKMQDLIVDGKTFSSETTKLSDVLRVGEILSAYFKGMPPKKIGDDILCQHTAVQIWRGKRTPGTSTESLSSNLASDSSAKPSNRSTMPPPSKATHLYQVGKLTEIDASVAKARLQCSLQHQQEQRVLITKHRHYSNGKRLQFKEI